MRGNCPKNIMALLIDTGISGWMRDEDLRDQLLAHLPGGNVRMRGNMGNTDAITMVAVADLSDDLPALLPNPQPVQKLGAGVETIVAHPALPGHVRVTRLKPEAPARKIAEFFLAYILRGQRNRVAHDAAQTRQKWEPIKPRMATLL
jgi:glyoxylate/hydroxypyruvate reductase